MVENLRDKIYYLMKVGDHNSPQYLIAQEILNEINAGEKLNSSTIAERCYTSKPTVIRFAKSLGFNGFKEFNEAMVAQDAEYFFIDKVKSYEQSYYDYNIVLKKLIAELDKEQSTLIEIAKLIQKKKKIYIFSSKQHLTLMKTFSEKLRFLNIEVFESSVVPLFFLNTINKNDLALFLLSGMEEREILKVWTYLDPEVIKVIIASPRQLEKTPNPNYFIKVDVGPNLLRTQLQSFLFYYLLDQLYNLIVYSDDKFLNGINQIVFWY